ncbi:MAG: nuclear transport factor 2 family protein [Pseudomonadota bacterium]
MIKQNFSIHRISILALLLQTSVVFAETDQAMQIWLAKQEIAELQRRYAQATDMIAADSKGNEAKVAAIYQKIFTKDSKLGVLNQLTLDGPTPWLELVKTTFVPLRGAQHMIGSQVVEIESLPDQQGKGGKAKMRSYLQATHVNSDDSLEIILGTYISTVTYQPGVGWQISEMMLELLSREVSQVAPALQLETPE